MTTQLNDIIILVNDEQVAYTADSLSWKDGFGEYQVRNAIVGGGQTEQVFSQALDTKFGMVKFSMPSTPENEALKRSWKVNLNNNVVELVGSQASGFTKIFTLACLLDDPETNAAADGNIEVDFNTNPAS